MDGLDAVEMTALREALRGNDALAQAWFRIGAGDAAGARADLKRLLREQPRNPNTLHLLGIAATAEKRWVEARSALRRSLRIRPDGWVALQMVNLLLDRRSVAAARRLIGGLPDELQHDPRIRRASAYVQVASGDAEAALAELKQLEKDAPEADVAYQLAVLHIELGDSAAAVDALSRAVKRASATGRYHRLLFEQLASLSRWEQLIEASSRTGAAAAGGGLDSYYRGLALHRLGRAAEAVRAFSAVSAHGGAEQVALAGSAAYLLQLGAFEAAEHACRASMGGSTSEPSLHHLLGIILTRQGRESEALAHYRRAVDEHAAEADYRSDLLLSLCALERTTELEETIERALKDFPEDERFARLKEGCPTSR
jgi:Flp pilus assembly protein TadD